VEPPGSWAPIHVSATEEVAQVRVVASRSHRGPRLERTLAALGAREVRPLGSAGLKGAQVAEGVAEAYVHTGRGLKRWDVCAVDALVTAAGGRVSDVTGAPIDYRARSLACERGLLASNGLTHDAILARMAQGDRRRA
jgi:3'(2'), 5'-bisphosphate nucleotidase